jgi:hypothetical protein
MKVWTTLKAAAAAWYSSDRLAEGARYKARLMGPTFLVFAVVAGVARQWGISVVCAGAGIIFIGYSLGNGSGRGG